LLPWIYQGEKGGGRGETGKEGNVIGVPTKKKKCFPKIGHLERNRQLIP